jgi:hypothetical protein
MGQLEGDGPRAKNDDRLRNVREIQDIVAGRIGAQARDVRNADDGPGGEMTCGGGLFWFVRPLMRRFVRR